MVEVPELMVQVIVKYHFIKYLQKAGVRKSRHPKKIIVDSIRKKPASLSGDVFWKRVYAITLCNPSLPDSRTTFPRSCLIPIQEWITGISQVQSNPSIMERIPISFPISTSIPHDYIPFNYAAAHPALFMVPAVFLHLPEYLDLLCILNRSYDSQWIYYRNLWIKNRSIFFLLPCC